MKRKNELYWIGAAGGELHGLLHGVKLFSIDSRCVLRSTIANIDHCVPCASLNDAKNEAQKIVAEFTARRSKYRAKRVEVDGITFDSKGEAGRWSELRLEESVGVISNLRRQVAYRIEVNGVKICSYRADFVYEINGETVVEDFKGMWTPKFRLVHKLMKAVHGIEIKISGNSTGKTRGKKNAFSMRARWTRSTKKQKRAA